MVEGVHAARDPLRSYPSPSPAPSPNPSPNPNPSQVVEGVHGLRQRLRALAAGSRSVERLCRADVVWSIEK